jgi:hypothetical protein
MGLPYSEFSAAAVYGAKVAAQKFTQPDQFGQQLAPHSEDQEALDFSLSVRLYWANTGLRALLAGTPSLMARHLTSDYIMSHRLKIWFQNTSRVVGVQCPVFALALFAKGTPELKRKALFLQFAPLSLQNESSLQLEHFLVWHNGRPRTIVTLADLVEALKGVGLWLTFLLGALWRGVMNGFLADVEDDRYLGFPMRYVVRFVYDALERLYSLAREVRVFPEEPLQSLRDTMEQQFTDITTHLNANDVLALALASNDLGILGLDGPRSAATTGFGAVSPAPTLPASHVTPVRLGAHLSASNSGPAPLDGVCYGAFGERYGAPNSGCKLAVCPRMHFHHLPAGTTKTSLAGMFASMKESTLRVTILEGIKKDPELLA